METNEKISATQENQILLNITKEEDKIITENQVIRYNDDFLIYDDRSPGKLFFSDIIY